MDLCDYTWGEKGRDGWNVEPETQTLGFSRSFPSCSLPPSPHCLVFSCPGLILMFLPEPSSAVLLDSAILGNHSYLITLNMNTDLGLFRDNHPLISSNNSCEANSGISKMQVEKNHIFQKKLKQSKWAVSLLLI